MFDWLTNLFKDNRPKLTHRISEVRERFNAFAASIDEELLMMRSDTMTDKEQCNAISRLSQKYRDITTWSSKLIIDAAYSGVYKADVNRANAVDSWIKYCDTCWSEFMEMMRRKFHITSQN